MLPLHPFVVHFPIVLLTAGVVLDLASRVIGSLRDSRIGWWAHGAGTLSLAFAVASGLFAREQIAPPSGAALTGLESHQLWAFLTTAAFVALTLWRAGCRGALPPRSPRLYLVTSTLAVIALWVTAAFGGELVYTFGIGVIAPGP